MAKTRETKAVEYPVRLAGKRQITLPPSVVAQAGRGDHFRPVEVKVEARNPDEVAISGVPSTATVALVDIEKKETRK